MRTCCVLLIAAVCVSLTGCGQGGKESRQPVDTRLLNTKLIEGYNDIAIHNAIVSQHTLYPYHFTDNSAQLNELGGRDLAVLGGHFAENPGKLNIRRGGVEASLYTARVETVVNGLREAGVDTDRVEISSGMPGGAGMPTERVIVITAPEEGAKQRPTTVRRSSSD
jgi:hypothetical protein